MISRSAAFRRWISNNRLKAALHYPENQCSEPLHPFVATTITPLAEDADFE
jgi:hypothetical protein